MPNKIRILIFLINIILVITGCSHDEPVNSSNAGSIYVTGENSDYGDTGGLKLPIAEQPVTITVVVDSAYPVSSNLPIIDELKNRTGIQLNIQHWSSSIYKDKLNITLASRNIPDIISISNREDINALGMSGELVPVNKYINMLPNFKKTFVDNMENSWVFDYCSADDNNLYFWPWYDVNRDVNHGFLYRKDIFDKHGIREWTNTEEFYQALKKLKGLYPESTPYVSKTKEKIFSDWAYGWGLHLPMYFDESSRLWKFAYTQPEYKDMLDFMKMLYNEGLIDPDFLNRNIVSWTDKMTQRNKAFVTYDWIDRMDLFYEKVKNENPEYDLRYAYPIGPVGKIRRLDKITGYGVSIANNTNKETALKFLDYTLSPSGTKLLTIGIEGITYNKDSSGKYIYTDTKGKKAEIDYLTQKFGLFLMGLYTRIDRQSIYFDLSPKLKEAQDKMLNKNLIEDSDPYLKYTQQEDSVIASLYVPLDNAAKEFSANYVLNKAYDQKEWNEWVKNANNQGYKTLEQIYNNAQKRRDN